MTSTSIYYFIFYTFQKLGSVSYWIDVIKICHKSNFLSLFIIIYPETHIFLYQIFIFSQAYNHIRTNKHSHIRLYKFLIERCQRSLKSIKRIPNNNKNKINSNFTMYLSIYVFSVFSCLTLMQLVVVHILYMRNGNISERPLKMERKKKYYVWRK